MMPGRSVSSAKFSGVTLKERQTGAGISGVTANIFPPILKTRSSPHWICSVVPGKERQSLRSASMCMAGRLTLILSEELSLSRKERARKARDKLSERAAHKGKGRTSVRHNGLYEFRGKGVLS